jgi:uncharacterized protein
MKSRSIFRGIFWTLVGLALVAHIGGGWYYSSRVIDEAFVPDPDPIVATSGDYELVEVSYQTPLGQMEAWHLPADGTTWVIHVHGLGSTPAEAEHLFAPLQQAGYPQLAITYRNDEGQPADPSGYYGYGTTEFEDIAGAMDFAQANGAEAVVFSGFSSGASHILSFAFKNNLDDIKGMIFDAPNIDLGDTVDFRGSTEELPLLPINVPPTLSWVAKFFTSLRIGVNWKSIDYVEKAAGSLRVPVLVHHGTEDESVPLSQSIDFAATNPDLVRLVQVPGAGHVDSYDADPDGYVEEVLQFLDQVG